MKKQKNWNFGSMICNVLALIFVTCAILRFFTDGGDANMKTYGISCLRYFTNLSNIFAALTCAAALPFNIAALVRARRGGDGALRLPPVLFVLKFVASTAVGVTFFTVVFFLAPLWGDEWWMMFSGNTFWLHLICPLLCLAATVFLEADRRLRLRSALWGVLPTLVYGIVYFLMVIVIGEGNGGWEDFYQFNMGGFWYISAVVMLAGTYLLSLCILALMNRMCGVREDALAREREGEEFASSAPEDPPVLRVRGLTKSFPSVRRGRRKKGEKRFGRHTVLDHVSFDVAGGEIVGFLGPNGAGKTTTIKILLGLLRADRGRAAICGHETLGDFEGAMANVGAVIENPELYKYLTGRKNLEVFAELSGGVPAERIDAVVRLVRMEDRINEKVSGYSLGMRQRLGLAQALLNRPRLLILDEPMNGLDPEGILELRNTLLRYAHEENGAVLISSHQLGELERLCDRVIVIDRGVLLRSMTMEEALRSANGGGNVCSVTVECDLHGAQPPAGITVSADGRLHAVMPRAEIPRLVSALAAAGADVYSVISEGRSLEEAFLEIVSHDAAAAAAEPGTVSASEENGGAAE